MNLLKRLKSICLEKIGKIKNNRVGLIAIVCTCFGLVLIVGFYFWKSHEGREYARYQKAYEAELEKYNTEIEKTNAILGFLKREVNASAPLQVSEETKKNTKTVKECKQETAKLKKRIDEMEKNYVLLCQYGTKLMLSNYNSLATDYNEFVNRTSIYYLDGVNEKFDLKDLSVADSLLTEYSEEEVISVYEGLLKETQMISDMYVKVQAITNPTEEFVLARLKEVDSIKECEAVTIETDINGLLGKDGGYKGCIYFSALGIDQSKVEGASIAEKGTDAGGAVEIYDSVELALNRCDYLSQFDNTLLYSGSYTIVGTMVIRTSYMLTTVDQASLTSEIITKLTEH